MSGRSDRKTSLILLALGAIVGIGLATLGIFSKGGLSNVEKAPGVAATVNGTLITLEEYGRALVGFESERREPISQRDRAYILDRLIEEELLVQRGIDIGLADNDRSVRSAIVRSMIDTIVAESAARPVDDAELTAFFDDNKALFAQTSRLHIGLLRFQSPDEADQASKRLNAGEAIEDVGKTLNITRDPMIPNTLLPLHKLREYIGPSALDVARNLQPGTYSSPLTIGASPSLLHLVALDRPEPPALEDIRTEVDVAFRNQRDDKALREYLEWLKKKADITRADLNEVIE